MGNCDSCIGVRERRSSFEKPIQKFPANEIQSGDISPRENELVNYRILPFDRRPSIKIPDATEKPPRKHRGI